MLKIGEIAKMTGVSIRSLRHYDEIGLLKPSTLSDAGYRLYSKTDVSRLMQIVSLKQMRFSLKEIQQMFEDDISLQKTLCMHQRYLQNQRQELDALCSKLDQLLVRLDQSNTLSLDMVQTTLEHIAMLEKYYTKDQLDDLNSREFHQDQKKGEQYAREWLSVFGSLEQLREKGVDASSDKTKPYALKSRELLSVFTAGNEGIQKSLKTMQENEGGSTMLKNHGLDVSDELYAYYEATLQAHVK